MPWLNWGWVGVAASCLAAGFVAGCQHKQAEIDRLLAAGEAQNAQTAQTITKHKQIAQDVKNDYETRIAAIRAGYGLRSPGRSQLPPVTTAASGSDGAASYVILAEQCTETTQQLVSLQDFIKETQ
jgi:outer membrane murein-binding lipoprotein Lpp